MTKVYPAIIHEENGSYWVEFPDLEGCSTYGETLEETLDLASEALGLYLVSLPSAGSFRSFIYYLQRRACDLHYNRYKQIQKRYKSR